jgi:NAD(P)-dependent dehydrogenase (short-subunit alcohol dehydrogenase family)
MDPGGNRAALDGRSGGLGEEKKEIPLRQPGTGEEFAEAVCFLISRRSAFITGAVLTVDGGESL